MQAVILAAGRGTRLAPVTDAMPKAMVDINGTPLVGRILDALPSAVREILLVVGYRREQITAYVGTSWRGIPVTTIDQPSLDGTGAALYLARERLADRFLVVNGDDIYGRDDLERLTTHDLAILVAKTSGRPPATATLNEDGTLRAIEPTPAKSEALQICGAYQLDQRFFGVPLVDVAVRDHREYSLPHTLAALAARYSVAVEYATRWIPVGTPEELAFACSVVR